MSGRPTAASAFPMAVVRPRRSLAAAVLVATMALAAAGCSSDASAPAAGQASSTTKAAGGPATTAAPGATITAPPDGPSGGAAEVATIGTYPVGSTEIDLVDTTRDTPANRGAAASEGRKLPTVVLYPADGEPGPDPASPTITDGADHRAGRYPLLVFSHGVTARGIFYRGELAAFASAGYVVIAPDYPLSNADSPGGPTIADVGNQPADASFLIDRFTDQPDGDTEAVAEHVDADRVGAVGHSLGAITSLGLGYGACCADDRVGAVAAWAGLLLPLQGKPNPEAGITDRPLLLIHGTKDGTVPYGSSVAAFAKVESPRWFITLPGQGHVPPFISPGQNEAATLTTLTTLDFFDAELKGDPEGIDRLEAAVADAGPELATIESAGR